MTSIVDVVTEMLGVAIHELLYVRRLYPSEVFESCRYLGMDVHAAQHPGIVSYISNFLRIATPALCERVADTLCLVIVSNKENTDLERYIFEFDTSLTANELTSGNMLVASIDDEGSSSEMVQSRLVNLERNFRDLLLRIITLSADPRRSILQSDATFKLSLRKKDRVSDQRNLQNTSETVIDNEVKSGNWIQPLHNSFDGNGHNGMKVFRAPLKTIDLSLCGLSIIFSLDRIQMNE